MKIKNQFDETIYQVLFAERADAMRFAKMIGANPKCFSLIGVAVEEGAWRVNYRARKECPWRRDPRGLSEVA